MNTQYVCMHKGLNIEWGIVLTLIVNRPLNMAS